MTKVSRETYGEPYEIDLTKATQAEIDEAWMTLAHARKYVVEIMGFADADLKRGLITNTIKTIGEPDGKGGFHNIQVQCGGLVRWVAHLMETDRRPKN